MILIKDNVERVVTSKSDAEKLKKQGYKPVETMAKDTAAAEDIRDGDKAPADLESMTVAQLREVAKEKGIKSAGSLSKTDLLALLEGSK